MFEAYIQEKSESIKNELIKIRRDIHANPELGLQEVRTASIIEKELNKLGITIQKGVGVTGIVGILNGNYPGKTIMLRADMDCLKVLEQNEVPYKSKIDGLMHACGHDGHTAWLIGAAMILSGLKDKIHGTVKFVFQPGEEYSGGAKLMIQDGVLENPSVDAVVGGHVWPYLQSGQVGIKSGVLMAGVDNFTITIKGKGGHGGQPHKCVDPLPSACEIYMAFQTIISRNMNPLDAGVITIGKFVSGTAHNAIPDKVEMEGTIRTFTNENGDKIPLIMERIIKGITEANGTEYEFNHKPYHPPVINDEKTTDMLTKTSIKLFGNNGVTAVKEPSMAGEDFSCYQKYVQGVFFWMGTGNTPKHTDNPLHNAKFNLDEDVIYKASMLFAQFAVDFLSCY